MLNSPISRNNMFYSEEDFEYEVDTLIEYLENDTNQTVIVYEVDRRTTSMNSTYNESNGNISYKLPVELPCLYEIKESELKAYDNKTSNAVYAINGSLTVYTLEKLLKSYQCDIKRGDYLGIQTKENEMAYFVVTNDGKVNTSNNLVVGAYKTPWRVIHAAPVTIEEFNAK